MSFRTHVAKLLGACVVGALALLALGAVGAQAAEWQAELAGGTIDKNISASIESEKDTTPTMLTKVGVNTVAITCENISVTGNLSASEIGTATITLTTCSTKLNGAVSAVCKPAEPITANFKLEQFLHTDGLTYHLFSPESGTTFTTIELGSGECAIGKKFEAKGTLVMEDCLKAPSTFLLRHLVQQVASATLFSSGAHINAAKIGANAASLDGSLWIKLAGAFGDRPWLGVA